MNKKKAALLAVVTLLTAPALAGCGEFLSGPDYGNCLKKESSWELVTLPSGWPQGMGMNGGPTITLTNTGGVSLRQEYVTRCTEWQYPTGKPTTLR